MKLRYFKKEQLNTIPPNPGIYVFRGKDGILYIGKATNLKDRVKSHFHAPSSRDHLFMDKVRSIGIIETESDIEALLLESQLIKKLQPRYNVMWKDDKRYFYIAITKESLPKVYITHQPFQKETTSEHATYIGPFVDGKPLKRALRILRTTFPYYTGKTHPKVMCSYCHLEMCPGPNPDQKTYRSTIKNLIVVLEGKKSSLVKKLSKKMNILSQKEQYEEAASLRDTMQALEAIFRNAKLVQRYTPIKGISDWNTAQAWLQQALRFHKRISRMEAYDISNIQGKEATGSMVVFIEGKPAKQFYRKFKIRLMYKKPLGIDTRSTRTSRYNVRRSQAVGSDPNDFAMMKELMSRRISHKEWGFPDVMLIDGGKGQLSSAMSALETKSIPSLKVVALAKRNNELFVEGKKEPLLLKDMPAPLSNVLLRIRDEAHRFAITYHRKLRRMHII